MAKRGKSARKKGHDFEREVAQWFRDNGWINCVTSRSESKNTDDKGVDLMFTAPFNIQCKAQENISPSLHVLLTTMPRDDNYNIVIHKKNNKGTIVAMSLETFGELIVKGD